MNRHKFVVIFWRIIYIGIHVTRKREKSEDFKYLSFITVCPIVRESVTQLRRRVNLRMRGGSVCIPPPSSETGSPLAAPAHRQ